MGTIIFLVVVVVIVFWLVGIYNGLITARNGYKNAFAQIDVQLQRRYDLIPNLVETAKGYLTHERETLETIAKAREAWKKAHPDAKPCSGPFPYRTTVSIKRQGADVPQTLKVTFADGSTETVRFSGKQEWFRWSWVRPSKAVKVELDPAQLYAMDRSVNDNVRALDSNSDAGVYFGSRALAWMQVVLAWLMGA